MKPVTLKFQAFGPYVEEQVIDFEQISKHGIFLIQGETGSGKTIILDAITYALYGKSSGGQREDLQSMRCRYAPNSLKTFVEFTFMSNQKLYKFIRSVEVREKRDHTLTHKVSVDAGIIQEGMFLPFFENPKLRSIEEKANEIIGLTHDQFVQVIMLPQGKFEQLLVSKSEEKQEILKTLFQSDRWSLIIAYLSDKMKLEKEKLETLHQRQEVLLQSVNVESLDILEASIVELQTKDEQEAKAQDYLQPNIDNLQIEVQLQRELYKNQMAVQKAQLRLNELDSRNKEYANLKDEIEHLKLYMKWKPYYEACQQGKENLTYRIKQEQDILKDIDKQKMLIDTHADRRVEYEHKNVEMEEKKALLKSYESMQDLYQTIDEQKQSMLQMDATYKNVNMEFNQMQKEVRDVTDEVEKSEQALKLYQEDELRFHEDEKKYMRVQQGKQLFDTLKKIEGQLQKDDEQKHLALSKISVLKKEVFELEKQHDKQYNAYLENTAMQLSARLKDDQPCPVCGSLNHPTHAVLRTQLVNIEQLKEVKQKLASKKEVVDKEQLVLKKIEASMEFRNMELIRMKSTLEKMGGYHDLEYENLTRSMQAYEVHKINNAICLKKSVRIKDELVKKEFELKKIEKDCIELQHDVLKLKTIIDEKSKNMIKDVHSYEELQGIMLKLNAEILDLKGWVTSESKKMQDEVTKWKMLHKEKELIEYELVKAKESYEKATSNLYTFENKLYEDYDHELFNIDETMLRQKEQSLQIYEQSLRDVTYQIQTLKKDLDNKEIKDLKVLDHELMEMQEQMRLIIMEKAKISASLETYKKTVKKVKEVDRKICCLRPQFLKSTAFVKAIRGDTSIGIERYVLGIMLTQITQTANTLLQNIHDGRYQIYRSNEASGKTRKFGLELMIYDHYSCSHRSVVSLSGGEKFLVSLSLSMALSIVVQARTGAMHIDAMFIDEGFGSLDERSIEDALQVLSVMSSKKSMIGIISHVDILKDNIMDGIVVTKSKLGSQLTYKT